MGDPAGVGPELVARLCHDQELRDRVDLVVVGREFLLSAGAMVCGLDPPEVELVEVGQGAEIKPGQPSAQSGRQAGAFIEEAVRMCLDGQVQAMTTAPVSKEALRAGGYPDTGHTTMLGRLTGVKQPVMMMVGSKLRVALVTVHKALREVPGLITTESIVQVGRVAHTDLQRYLDMERPRLAVAALNPHAGEGGMFGDEEERIIAPAVRQLQEMGVQVSGPHPPDTVFYHMLQGHYDLVICMYHDQGLIPFKLRHFDRGVNVTLGLPLIRTSPDHGTAYDIAGQGKARPDSLKAAILTAALMASRAASRKET